ncbi:retrovirus-related Pol polyprotein from transposon 412 [Trichonephila clavipes]|nr:retrovirus-related Pol polyprotein from transposon 412 [Trichonephila clavipes]
MLEAAKAKSNHPEQPKDSTLSQTKTTSSSQQSQKPSSPPRERPQAQIPFSSPQTTSSSHATPATPENNPQPASSSSLTETFTQWLNHLKVNNSDFLKKSFRELDEKSISMALDPESDKGTERDKKTDSGPKFTKDGTVESTDTIAKLKTKIENSSTFESDPDFVKTLIQNCIDERVSRNEREVTLEKQKIELAKLQLAKLEKEIELQTAKKKALSLNPAAKVEDKQFETNIENMIKSETYIQFAARLTANFQYYCSLRKVNSFESLCDLIISDKLFETLNKETATHIGIREAEDWFRPIDLAKECDIYISSRSGSHKEIPITYGYTQDPFKNRSQNFKPKIKENYPQYLERENKNCFICGDSSHYARDCEKRFKPKESNDHIHNRINVNTLKVESEKQNSDEFANLQYVNIFVENQPVTALIDSGCQIPVLNSSLIRVNQPSKEIITLSSCFGEQRMVEVKPINLSLNQHSSGLSVRTAISPTLTEEIIIHPSVYAEIKKLGHAKSDVLLSESGSSLSADSGVSFPNVSVSNVIENSSYDLTHVKNFNTRNDLSSLIKDYKFLVCSVFFVCFRFSSGLDEKGKKEDVPLRTAYSQAGRCGMQPKAKHSLRAQAQLSETKTETRRL